jgi:20S proteasome subunit alpha 4
MSSYDRAITVFSPDGHLFQVEYAVEAVKRGAVTMGVLSNDEIILAVEKKTLPHLQDPRTVRKIVKIDDHLTLAFSGLAADSRLLIDRARVKCQSHRLTYEEPITVEQCARFIAQTQQEFTHKGGRRPFGLSTLIVGFDRGETPRLFMTDPSGTYSEWKAVAIGRSQQSVTKFIETLYFQEPPLKENQRDQQNQQAISLVAPIEVQNEKQSQVNPLEVAVKVLSEIVEREEQSMEILRIKKGQQPERVSDEEIKKIITEWKTEKEENAKLGKSYDVIVVDSETA